MLISYKCDIITLDVKSCINADYIYIYNLLNMFNELLKLIDLKKTVYKKHETDNYTIVFYLSNTMCLEFFFNELYTYEWTLYLQTVFNEDIMSISYDFINDVPLSYIDIDIVESIKYRISLVKSFLFNTNNVYMQSLKSAFMRTY